MFTGQASQIQHAARNLPQAAAQDLIGALCNCAQTLEHRGPVDFSFQNPWSGYFPGIQPPPGVQGPFSDSGGAGMSPGFAVTQVNFPEFQPLTWENLPFLPQGPIEISAYPGGAGFGGGNFMWVDGTGWVNYANATPGGAATFGGIGGPGDFGGGRGWGDPATAGGPGSPDGTPSWYQPPGVNVAGPMYTGGPIHAPTINTNTTVTNNHYTHGDTYVDGRSYHYGDTINQSTVTNLGDTVHEGDTRTFGQVVHNNNVTHKGPTYSYGPRFDYGPSFTTNVFVNRGRQQLPLRTLVLKDITFELDDANCPNGVECEPAGGAPPPPARLVLKKTYAFLDVFGQAAGPQRVKDFPLQEQTVVQRVVLNDGAVVSKLCKIAFLGCEPAGPEDCSVFTVNCAEFDAETCEITAVECPGQYSPISPPESGA